MTVDERRFLARAWAIAPIIEAVLLGKGLAKTVEWIKGRSSDPPPAPIPIERASELTRWAFRLHPLLRGKCLEQSVTQFYLHHRDGATARLVVGVRKDPDFAAHAWVEGGDWSPDEVANHRSVFDTGTSNASSSR